MNERKYFIWQEKVVENEFPYIVFHLLGVNVEKIAAFKTMGMAQDYIQMLERKTDGVLR